VGDEVARIPACGATSSQLSGSRPVLSEIMHGELSALLQQQQEQGTWEGTVFVLGTTICGRHCFEFGSDVMREEGMKARMGCGKGVPSLLCCVHQTMKTSSRQRLATDWRARAAEGEQCACSSAGACTLEYAVSIKP